MSKMLLYLGLVFQIWGTVDVINRLNHIIGSHLPDKALGFYSLGVLVSLGKVVAHSLLVTGASSRNKLLCLTWIVVSVMYTLLRSLGYLSILSHSVSPDDKGRGYLYFEIFVILIVSFFVLELDCNPQQVRPFAEPLMPPLPISQPPPPASSGISTTISPTPPGQPLVASYIPQYELSISNNKNWSNYDPPPPYFDASKPTAPFQFSTDSRA